MNSDRYQIDDDEAEVERDDGYLEYALQIAFEDLCGLIGFERACARMEVIVKEHLAMLKRQGRH